MADRWLKIGSTIINPDRIIAVLLGQQWSDVPEWRPEVAGPAEDERIYEGVEIILDVRRGDLTPAELFPALFGPLIDDPKMVDHMLRLRFPDGSPEAEAIRAFFSVG